MSLARAAVERCAPGRLGRGGEHTADPTHVSDPRRRRRCPGARTGDRRRALARGRDGRRKGGAHPRGAVPRALRLLRGPRRRPEGRAHVAFRRGRQRCDRRGRAERVAVSRRVARAADRGAGARAPGRAARGGHDRGALPRAQAGAGLGRDDAGDLHAAGTRRGSRARHAPHGGGVGDGHDGVPVRAGADRGSCPRAPRGAGLRRGADRCGSRERAGRDAQPARSGDAAGRLHRGRRLGVRMRACCCASPRRACRRRSTS